MDYIVRKRYLQQLIDRMNNGDVKIVTGPRRSGKSWLLSHIFFDYLLSQGVKEDQVVYISLDMDDENNQTDLLNPTALKEYLYSRIVDKEKQYYIILDEVQDVPNFERIVNGLSAKENVDVYITGSNSHYLSSDIKTIFRGRGDEVRVWPLSFGEFCTGRDEPQAELWKEYYTYGGLPGLRKRRTAEQKNAYLQRLWKKTYLDDIIERHHVLNVGALEALADVLCSSVGSLSNPSKLSRTIESVMHTRVDSDTVSKYLSYFEDSFLFEGVKRYNIKGKRYFESIKKYYSVDIGLRNAKLNYRQQEITHIMENVIYNELRMSGFLVDVGVVEVRKMQDGKQVRVQHEVDFIATNGAKKYYIQSAYRMDDDDKRQQESCSLKKIDDNFQKIIIQGDDIAPYVDSDGIAYMGLMQFLREGLSSGL